MRTGEQTPLKPLKPPKKAATRTIAILAITVSIAGYALLRSIPMFLDTGDIKRQIEDGLHKSTGVNFAIKDLTLEPTIFHGIQAHLNTTTITDMRHHPLGSVENISVQIRYLPLLTRQTPEIAKVHLNRVRVPVGEYSLFTSVKLKLVPPEKTGFLNPAELKNAEILLTNYLIEDSIPAETTERAVKGATGFRVAGKQISVKHLESKKPISVLGYGELAYLLKKDTAEGEQTVRPMGEYRLFLEIPQAVTKKETFSIEDLARLELKLDGAAGHVDFKYAQQQGAKKPNGQKNQKASPLLAEGNIQSSGLDVFQAQALVFQLADTLGLPIPSEYSPYWATGKTRMDTQFKLAFENGQPVLKDANGYLNLDKLAVYANHDFKTPIINQIMGEIRLKGQTIELKHLEAWAQGIPANAKGTYNIATDKIDAKVYAHNLNVDKLRKNALALGAPPSLFAGRTVGGLLNVDATISGTGKNPSYKGLASIKNGEFSDQNEGIYANHFSGKIAFNGQGLTNPLIRYDGGIDIHDGKLMIASQGLNVNRFDGKVGFKGQARPLDKTVAMPTLSGAINVQDADLKDPQTGIPVTDIKGVIRLAGDLIHIDNFRALLAGSEYQANGELSTNLTDYRVRLTGNHIDVPRLKREILPKVPELQSLVSLVDVYSGQGKLDLTVATGLNLSGHLDVHDIAMRTGEPTTPIQLPHVAIAFNGPNVVLRDTDILYGPVNARVGGTFTTAGAYNVRLDSGDVPVSLVRDNQALIAALAETELPEIWNTAGDFRAVGTVSNRATDVTVSFSDAGLSWAGGDFPVYNTNGNVVFHQSGKNTPIIHSNDLTLRYGNTPIMVDIHQQDKLAAEIQGRLSDLVVNHFLVSPQSNATPYREMPFRAVVNGSIVAIPGQPGSHKNHLVADLGAGLTTNFREAYSDLPITSTSPNQADEPDPELNERNDANNNQTAPDVIGKDRQALKNINAINAANTVLGATTTTVDILKGTVKGTVGKGIGTVGKGISTGIGTLKKPAQFVAQRVREKPHESVDTKVQGAEEISLQASDALLDQEEGEGRAFVRATLRLDGNNAYLERGLLHLFEGGDILADGQVLHIDKPDQLSFNGHVRSVPELNIEAISTGAVRNQFFQGAKGTIGLDVWFTGDGTGPKHYRGWAAANRLEVPYLSLLDVTGKVDLDGETAKAVVPSFKIPGVTARAEAATENLFETPITLENVKIDGSFVSIASLADFNNEVIKPKIVDQVVHNYMRPWQQGDPTSPIQFRNAELRAEELIYENIILSDLSSNFSVNSNSFFELTNTKLEAAGGTVSGYLSMSPNERSFTTLELNAEGVKANALTKALLDVTNEIFGDLDGTIRFTTFGETDQELQKNANGTVTMKITNGRLPAIAKVETLLAAANVVRGGILGLNLNNLFRSLTILDNNYFAELSGDMLINDQILYTQNLVSDGVNLDLLIQGSLRMDNGNANMLVNGRMSQDIRGKLGALGNLSLGQLVRYIPALGTFGKNQPGLLGYLPGVGYVPGFGGPAGKFNRFQVRIVGQPDDPSSIQDFQWVRPKNL